MINGIIEKVVREILKFLFFYMALCLIWMIVTWGVTTHLSTLKPGVDFIGFMLKLLNSITLVITKTLGKGFHQLLSHLSFHRDLEIWMYWLWIIVRVGVSIGGIVFLGKVLLEGISEGVQNHPVIFWFLLWVMIFSLVMYYGESIFGSFHVSRGGAVSRPWIDSGRLGIVLTDIFLRFCLGMYLISIICLFPHGPADRRK